MLLSDHHSPRLFRSKTALEKRSALSSLPYRLFLFALILAMGAASCVLRAQEKMKIPGQDWIQLFNGDNLDGWTKIGNESWTVEDGLIHGKGLTKDYGYLETANDYKDFQLSLRFKCVGDGNSGVFFHSEFKPGTADVTQGMQFEIDCKMMHHTAGVYAEDGREWVAGRRRKIGRRPHGRVERLPAGGCRQPLPLSFEWSAYVGLHRSQAEFMGWQDCIAIACRRTRQHAIQRYLDTGSVAPLVITRLLFAFTDGPGRPWLCRRQRWRRIAFPREIA